MELFAYIGPGLATILKARFRPCHTNGRQPNLPHLIGRANPVTTTPAAGRWAAFPAGGLQRHLPATRGYPVADPVAPTTSDAGHACSHSDQGKMPCVPSFPRDLPTGHPPAAARNLRPPALSAPRVVQVHGNLRPVSVNPSLNHSLHGQVGCLPCGKDLIFRRYIHVDSAFVLCGGYLQPSSLRRCNPLLNRSTWKLLPPKLNHLGFFASLTFVTYSFSAILNP
jgi:hypothetical protein